ncbi:unnamed protein product [Ectocarpus sp. 13 AM-2016]
MRGKTRHPGPSPKRPRKTPPPPRIVPTHQHTKIDTVREGAAHGSGNNTTSQPASQPPFVAHNYLQARLCGASQSTQACFSLSMGSVSLSNHLPRRLRLVGASGPCKSWDPDNKTDREGRGPTRNKTQRADNTRACRM